MNYVRVLVCGLIFSLWFWSSIFFCVCFSVFVFYFLFYIFLFFIILKHLGTRDMPCF